MHVLALCPHPEEARMAVSRLRETVPLAHDYTPAEFRQMPEVRAARWLPARLRSIEHSIKHFRAIERVVRQWEAESAVTGSEIFYACMYDWDFEHFRYAHPLLGKPWSGLCIRPADTPDHSRTSKGRRVTPYVDCISHDKKLRTLATLDEGIQNALAERVKRPVVVFPDFADDRMPGSAIESQLSERLRAFARNRPIVGLFGHLQRSKGLTTFCAAAQEPSLADVCFAAGGEVDWLSFSPDERRSLQSSLADSHNVWTHFARIPDEPRLNGLLATCSVLFAAYINFPHSSNILAKAAVLEKPVVVSDRSLMAERVRRFRLGEVVPEGDVNAINAAILRMTRDLDAWVDEHKPDWQSYRRRHSFHSLKAAFSEIFPPA